MNECKHEFYQLEHGQWKCRKCGRMQKDVMLEDSLAENARLNQKVKELTKLFESLTPGGSEFYNDPKRCVEHVIEYKEMWRKQAIKQAEVYRELETRHEELKRKYGDSVVRQCEKITELQAQCAAIRRIVEEVKRTLTEDHKKGLINDTAYEYIVVKFIDKALSTPLGADMLQRLRDLEQAAREVILAQNELVRYSGQRNNGMSAHWATERFIAVERLASLVNGGEVK